MTDSNDTSRNSLNPGKNAYFDDSQILIPGPWKHRVISANGSRFHLAETGNGPLIVLLHGFPEFWYSWRHLLPILAQHNYRAAAIDLRGYGASDKPPRGYDGFTLTADLVGIIHALGENDAIVIGHDWGGFIGWSAASLFPETIRQLITISAAHPLALRKAVATNKSGQLVALRNIFAFQTPRYEHLVTRDNALYIENLFSHWSGDLWKETDDFVHYRQLVQKSIQIPRSAFCALEYYRWSIRSLTRFSGWGYAKALRSPIVCPTLQLHGTADPYILPNVAAASHHYVDHSYTWVPLPGVGHFPLQEVPSELADTVIDWLKKHS